MEKEIHINWAEKRKNPKNKLFNLIVDLDRSMPGLLAAMGFYKKPFTTNTKKKV